MSSIPKNLLIGVFLLLGIYLLLNISNKPSQSRKVPFSEFLSYVENGRITEAVINGTGSEVSFTFDDRGTYSTNVPRLYSQLIPFLHSQNVHFRIEPLESGNFLLQIIGSWLPILLIIGVWIFFMKQMQGGNKMMGFGKSKPREINPDAKKITFADVAGIDEAKAELSEIVDYLKDPNKFEKLGGKIPKGVLLVGPPGTGKTLLSKAIAGEAGVGFFSISGSDFVEMFVGVGASRVRDLFGQARENSPCIVFIDEIDAVGRHRGSGMGGGNDEREQTLNQLLVEMDGFPGNNGVILIAATNRPDVLDPALTRPGRFDRQVIVPRPDRGGRVKILKVHVKGLKLAADIDLEVLGKATPGFTGADLANFANEAALLAARKNKDQIEMSDFEAARDKILMGTERRTLTMQEKELETTAYHEAGHAIVASLTKDCDPVHKVTIIPRGKALGLTSMLPKDVHSYNLSYLRGMLAMMMGGRAAEELIYNHFTTGASNDLERATDIAHQMVCKWGMTEKVGPIYLAGENSEPFLGGRGLGSQRKKISQSSARKIDQEVNNIVNEAYERAKALLKKNLEGLHQVTKILLDEETIDGKQVIQIVENCSPTTAAPVAPVVPTTPVIN